MSKSSKKGSLFWPVIFVVLFCLLWSYVSENSPGEQVSKNLGKAEALPEINAELLKHRYYDLTDEEQKIYDTLLSGVKTGALSFELEGAEPDAFGVAYTAFLYDQPEFFWLSSGYSYSYTRFPKSLSVELKTYAYWTYTGTPEKYIEEFNDAFGKIVAGGKQYTDDFDKVKYVHDYLARNVVYDHDILPEINNTVRSTAAEHALSTYGALVNGKTLCGGYSESFYLLCNALGVDCGYIQGEAGEPHAWNYLTLGGQTYYMDVTWDDMDLNGQDGKLNCPDGVSYRYFCITSEELQKTHTADTDFPVPDATATTHSYFHHEGCYFDTYDFSKVAAAYSLQDNMQIRSVKFGSEAELNKAVEELLDNRKWSSVTGFSGRKTISYHKDQELYVLTFFLPA